MAASIDVEVIAGNPHEAFVKHLGRDLISAQSISIIVGFMTRSGVDSIKGFLRPDPSRLKVLVVGRAGAEALSALSALKTELHLADEVLKVHLGRATEPVGYLAPNPFRPMMHSKIYYLESNGNSVAFIGSNNLTQFALGGGNCEAAVRLEGGREGPEFRRIRSHIDSVVRESATFDPSKADIYAAVNTRYLRSMIDEDQSTGLVNDAAIVLAALRTKPKLPKPGEILYFEVPANSKEYFNYVPGRRLELHLLRKQLSRNLRQVVQWSFKCFEAEVSMVDRTGLEGTQGTPARPRKVNWKIDGQPPALRMTAKYASPTKALQILAVFGQELRVKYDYFWTAPPVRFTSDIDYQNTTDTRGRFDANLETPDWKEIPTEVLEALYPILENGWSLVKDVTREQAEEPLLTNDEERFVWRVRYRRENPDLRFPPE